MRKAFKKQVVKEGKKKLISTGGYIFNKKCNP